MITTQKKNLILSKKGSANRSYLLEIYISDNKVLRTVAAYVKNVDSSAHPLKKEELLPGCYLLYKLSIPNYEKDFIHSLASVNGVSRVCLKTCQK